MASVRKLAAFRQLSLTGDGSQPRRRSLKKQFSEDLPEVPPQPVKIAWGAPDSPKEAVIVRQCVKEAKKTPKLATRHSSLEKDSILCPRPELTERLRQALQGDKRNINIFLAHNARDASNEDEDAFSDEPETRTPKITPALLAPLDPSAKSLFQIRKTKETAFASKSSAIVVIPFMEKHDLQQELPDESPLSSARSEKPDHQDPKAIKNVIIRPATAASKRERFQKRTNSAFNSVIKEAPAVRPPLVRSSSAPIRPDAKPKFLASKRRLKSAAKKKDARTAPIQEEDKPKTKKELNRSVPEGADIITMVSLVSPATSDAEEVEVEKPKPKQVEKIIVTKEDGPRNVSLRKTVKSVSFQQSSIHAIRSFSASFPARRSSMATALTPSGPMKNQKEKRGTNPAAPEDAERGPKRRLVRSASEKTKSVEEESEEPRAVGASEDVSIKVNISSKPSTELESEICPETAILAAPEDVIVEEPSSEEVGPDFGSNKEKECWKMYCKMTDKGLKVSYDTILRGMLTPTEYRMRRKEAVVEPVDNESPQP